MRASAARQPAGPLALISLIIDGGVVGGGRCDATRRRRK
jgi:hypothetical protein